MNHSKQCGLKELFETAEINTPGRVESLLDGGKVGKSCYVHQISLEALLNIPNEAFKSQSEITIYEEWEDHLKKSSVNAKY